MRFLSIIIAAMVLCAAGHAAVVNPAVSDSGFENNAAGWGWQVFNGCQTGFKVADSNPHTGGKCVEFFNRSAMSPHVYGRFSTTVGVLPEASYELSCWVRGEDVDSGAGHITDWNTYMLQFPSGTFGWQKVTTQFKTHAGQHAVVIGINIGNKCKALAVDDMTLRPLGGQLRGDGVEGIILTSAKETGHNTPVTTYLMVSCQAKGAAIEGVVTTAGSEVARKRAWLKPGENVVTWDWNTGKYPFGKYDCNVSVVNTIGDVLARGGMAIEVVDSPILADLDKVVARKKEFDKLYNQCRSRGIRLDYPAAAKMMLEQFIPLAQEDVRKGYDYRAKWMIEDFHKSMDDATTAMKLYLSDPKLAPVVRRYQTGKVGIDGLSFIADRQDSLGNKDRGPVFFCGHGHFGQVRKDIPIFPSYGVNIIQIEVGPSITFPTEDKVDLTAIRAVAKVLDDAAKHNIMVNVLLSPHYFPQWAMLKWPHLGKGGGGFLGFCVDAPEAKQVIEKFLRTAVPLLKDKPALHSFCLTNEPVFNNIWNCDNTKDLWVQYLKRTHGDIGTLNKRYETTYASFDDVPYGGDPQAYDWIICDMQRFLDWHKWMGGIIHEMAPNVPLHAKVMSNELNAGTMGFATDQELFGNAFEINGNDCYMFPTGNPDWPMDPWVQGTGYDMQRSFARKPIFNSENHIAPDGSNYYIPAGHFRTALWQGAIHGQGATTIWVWEHAHDNSNGFLGSVMDRPLCAQAVGTTCLDLNRFAAEVTALETAKAPVAIVYAMSSMIRHGDGHANAVRSVYYGLNSSGVKIDFISEKQLAEGKGAEYRMIVVPEAETITDAALEGLGSLPLTTRLLSYGKCFARNAYGKARPADSVKSIEDRATILPTGDPEKVTWPALRKELAAAGASPEIDVVDAKTGQPIWGVEWLPVKLNGRTIVNIVNFRGKPYDVKLMRDGREVAAIDLLSLTGRESVSTLKTLTPILAEVE